MLASLLRRLSSTPAALACAALLGTTLPAQPDYRDSLTLVPRTGQGLGNVPAYAGLTPVLAPNGAGHESVTVPSSDLREVNVVWSFWRHRMPSPPLWPAGDHAHTVFTLRAAAATSLQPRLSVRVGEVWTDFVPGPRIDLQAGRPALVALPLPADLPQGTVETLRLNFTSTMPIPELILMEWSVGVGLPGRVANPPAAVATSLVTDEPIYTPTRSLIPLGGDGTVSDYSGTTPRLEKDAQGFDMLQVPETGGAEVNLYWSFWHHKRPAPTDWPSGPAARASLTLRSPVDLALSTRLLVRTDTWSEPLPGPEFILKAGELQTFQLPLPAILPPGSVENVRIVLTARQKIPALTVHYWSVGVEK